MELTDKHNLMLRNAEQLKVTMDTMGWRTVVKPILDKMIEDCIGVRCDNGDWRTGAAHKDEGDVCHTSYSQALMEFSNKLYAILKQEEKIKEYIEEEATNTSIYNLPMEGTKYG